MEVRGLSVSGKVEKKRQFFWMGGQTNNGFIAQMCGYLGEIEMEVGLLVFEFV